MKTTILFFQNNMARLYSCQVTLDENLRLRDLVFINVMQKQKVQVSHDAMIRTKICLYN